MIKKPLNVTLNYVYTKMNTFRLARAVTRIGITPARLPLQRRGYAEAVSDKIKLTLALPHQVRCNLSEVLDEYTNEIVIEHIQID